MTKLNLFLCLAIALSFAGSVSAQAPGCDTGGPLALTVNGSGPDGASQVGVSNGTVANVAFSDGGSNNGIIVLFGLGVVCGALPTPWASGGSVDIAGPALLADGVGQSTGSSIDLFARADFSFAFTANMSHDGFTFQGVHQAPAAPPFFFDNTVAIELDINNTIKQVVNGSLLADDGFNAFALMSNTISLYGNTYSTAFVGTNGQVTFGLGSGDFSVTTAEFFAGWQGTPTTTANPGVAVMWGDYNRNNGNEGDYCVTEDLTTLETTVTFANQEHWNSVTPAGSFSCTFNANGAAGDLRMDHSAYIAGVALSDQNPMVGVSDGDSTIGANSDPTGALVGYVSGAFPDSIGHQYPMAGSDVTDPAPTGVTNWIDIGGGYTIF